MFDEDSPLVSPASRGRPSTQAWGIASLAIGCTLLLAGCALLISNIMIFHYGLRGIPLTEARIAGIVAVIGVALLGLASVAFGIRGWREAASNGESTGFGVAGTLTSIVGLGAWVIAGVDLLLVLGLFRM